jgi:hypothetical protein
MLSIGLWQWYINITIKIRKKKRNVCPLFRQKRRTYSAYWTKAEVMHCTFDKSQRNALPIRQKLKLCPAHSTKAKEMPCPFDEAEVMPCLFDKSQRNALPIRRSWSYTLFMRQRYVLHMRQKPKLYLTQSTKAEDMHCLFDKRGIYTSIPCSFYKSGKHTACTTAYPPLQHWV